MDRRIAGLALLALVAFALAGSGMELALEASPPAANESAPRPGFGEGAGPEPTSPPPPEPAERGSSPLSPLLLLSTLLAVGVASVLYWTRGARLDAPPPAVRAPEEEDDEAEEPPDDEERDPREAAGDVADRLAAGGDFENEIYRAWWEMTRSLSVSHPESATPGEFADAAMAAGLDPESVRTLTAVFEDVRYGRQDPAPRRDVAIAALRRIERGRSTPETAASDRTAADPTADQPDDPSADPTADQPDDPSHDTTGDGGER